MYNIALTGSTYSGKKTILKLFRAMDIPIFDADFAIKFLIHYNSGVIKNIKKKFGEKAYEIGFLNSHFFKSDKMIVDLITLTANDLREHYIKFLSKHPNAQYTIFKCSCFYEANFDKWIESKLELTITSKTPPPHVIKSTKKDFFDGVINVWAPDDVRVFRTYVDTVTKKLDNEYDSETKKNKSTFNIHSDDGVNVFKQVEAVHQLILAGDFSRNSETLLLKNK